MQPNRRAHDAPAVRGPDAAGPGGDLLPGGRERRDAEGVALPRGLRGAGVRGAAHDRAHRRVRDAADARLRRQAAGLRRSWFKTASTPSDDTAPSARPVPPGALAAPTHPRAPPEHLGSSPRPQEPASGRPKVEESAFNPQAATPRSSPSPSGRAWASRRVRRPLPLSDRPPGPAPPRARCGPSCIKAARPSHAHVHVHVKA